MEGIITDYPSKRARHGDADMIPDLGPLQYGFPNTIMTKLKYSSVYTLTSTLGAPVKQVFAANGLFDPDISGVGHQPLYFDQYTAIYGSYEVLGSKITATFANGNSANWVVGILGDDDGSSTSTRDTLLEQNNSVHKVLGYSTSGSSVETCFLTYSPIEHLGTEVGTDGFSNTLITANPTDTYFFALWAYTQDLSTGTCYATVTIEYTVKFNELITPTQS